MFSNSEDVWNHIRSSVTFKTYSDSKLASLYLDNPDTFPVHLLLKVFNVILDPLFKLEDITFESFWDIFDHISESRRQFTVARASSEIAQVDSSGTRSYTISPIAVSLVVDRMMEDRPSLGALVETKEGWRNAYKENVADLHAMSLVHPTWTPIARSALQSRVVVPYYQIDRFLLSPLCGPWVREMAVYWTVDNGLEGVTDSDLDLLKALLERMRHVRSLAFVTSLVWPDNDRETHHAPPFRVSECIEIMSDQVPDIENLWLKHFSILPEVLTHFGRYEEYVYESTSSVSVCAETSTLLDHLPKLRSLRFLSILGWDAYEPLELGKHLSLETLEAEGLICQFHVPQGELSLPALSCSADYWRFFSLRIPPSGLYRLEKLQIRGLCTFTDADAERLRSCDYLTHLEVSSGERLLQWGQENRFPPPNLLASLPPSLKYLKFQNNSDQTLLFHLLDRYEKATIQIQVFCQTIHSLPHLRGLVFSEPATSHSEWCGMIKSFDPDLMPNVEEEYATAPEPASYAEEEEGSSTSESDSGGSEGTDDLWGSALQEYTGYTIPRSHHPLIELCKERGIEFVVETDEGRILIC